MTTILAVDTATGPCSVAIWKDGGIAAYLENLKPAAQSATLMPMIEETLEKSHTAYGELTYVAATIGPGSFTGIRVGLAAARGICFAAGIKGLGFTTLEVMAFAARANPVLTALNAGKGEVYYQCFGADIHNEPCLDTLENAIASVGKNAAIVGNVMDTAITFPRADALAELAASQMASAKPLMPFYIRPPDAKLPAKKI